MVAPARWNFSTTNRHCWSATGRNSSRAVTSEWKPRPVRSALSSSRRLHLANTGFLLPGFPCMGAWVSYALGRLTDNLPAFVVLPDVRGLPYNQKGDFSSGFLPVTHQGTVISGSAPLPDLQAPPSA